ncbi:Molybdate transporter [Trema orientale]|uniref:Molybdate transporter n=1 Tax=Trema orientale TaxID=63057 RepID=A0A2P5D382_TREOI|nr:Molybdate transporter [Trema orientale]
MESQNQTPNSNIIGNPTPTSSFPTNLVNKERTNLVIHSKWAELNGAVGDLGTYVPLVLALTLAKDLNLGITLIFTGIYNIISGTIYGLPMPVQPLKCIVVVALSNGPKFDVPEIMAAGICIEGVMLVLGVTGLMQLTYKLVPFSIISGVQLAQGLSFALTALNYVENIQKFSVSKSWEYKPWLGLDRLSLAISCACVMILVDGVGKGVQQHGQNDHKIIRAHETNTSDQLERCGTKIRAHIRKFMALLPTALVIFLFGIIVAFIKRPKVLSDIKFGPSSMHVVQFSRHAWKEGFVKGTIPQLPLTVLNSVISICKLSSDLFPGKELSATLVSMTVGIMNVIGCWFGVVPSCHGAGGLATHYKFGGRSGGCVALLGVAKLGLGLALGTSLVKILSQFPIGFLGVMLFFARIELAMASRKLSSVEDSFVKLICTVVSLVGSDTVLGFVCGIFVRFLLRIRKFLE